MSILFANNAQTVLAGSISNTATALAVGAGTGALFPNPNPGDTFYITLTDAATRTNVEIMIVTSRVGDTFTVIRGQEGTAAQNWLANDIVTNRWTAAQAAAMLQQGQAQSQSGNYAQDVGSTNAYQCSLTPPISTPVLGMPIRVKIANTNTGASTFNPGSGAAPIHRADGSACIGLELIAGGIATLKWDGAAYQIMGWAPASGGNVGAQTDNFSFITPLALQQAFPFVFTSTGYVIFPGTVGTRLILEWGNTGTINSGTNGPANFPVTMTGGLLLPWCVANGNVPAGGGGTWGVFGGNTAGFTVVNQTGVNISFAWGALGRV
jgi:hypothetical protein